jgi:UDP-N-acetylmuramoyl-tripeptide--D-alanyl-D-alanine ligase
MKWTVARMLEATGGRLLQGDRGRQVPGISTDSRQLQAHDAFVPLVGERFDGHDFIETAVSKGVGVVFIEANRGAVVAPPDVAVIAVNDTLQALGYLARYWRRQHPVPVVGITGSNGKTSSKEMLTEILQQNLKVLKSQGNLNNLVGVPLTLLQLQRFHQVAVVEMGINVPGEMVRLVDISQPDVGLITNIQPAHLEGLKSPADILREKGLLWERLGADGLAVINLDDGLLRTFGQTLRCRRLTYSTTEAEADVHIRGGVHLREHGSVFHLVLGGQAVEVALPVLGYHQVQNAVAAAAVAYGMDQTASAIVQGLAQHRPVRQRMDIHCMADGTHILNDTYNANPRSVLAAVETIAAIHGDRPWVVVLGEMRELGVSSAVLHYQLGRQIGALGMDRLLTLGALAEHIAQGAREAGLPADRCYHGVDHDDIVARLKKEWVPGAWIVVKGSRGMTMEKVVEGILEV